LERQRAAGKLATLQGQVCAAHADVHRLLAVEAAARQRAEEAAANEEVARQAAEADALEASKLLLRQKREAKRERERALGQLARLEGHLGKMHAEAALAKKNAQHSASQVAELMAQLQQVQSSSQQQLQHVLQLKAKMAKRTRDALARATTADSVATQLKAAKRKLFEMRKEVTMARMRLNLDVFDTFDSDVSDVSSEADNPEDKDYSECDSPRAQQAERSALALQRLQSMPSWQPGRGAGHGKGAPKFEWGVRLVIYALLALMVPPSSIGMAIVVIVRHTAPWLKPCAPTRETVRRCRFELRYVEEALAARRVACAYRVRSIGFDETTKLGRSSLTSNVQIEPAAGAPLQDVILRAAYCPVGGTAEMVVQSIERRCFSRLRDMLRRWREMFDCMFPGAEWTGPDPAACSLHRLGGGGALISDTCSTARSARKLLADAIRTQVEAHLGSEAWVAMSEEEREAASRTHHVDCWQHLRNIFLAEMSRAQSEHAGKELRPELETFSAWERMSTDFAQLLRAAFKEFHHSCRYYKGNPHPDLASPSPDPNHHPDP
jgi:hypothetical protein